MQIKRQSTCVFTRHLVTDSQKALQGSEGLSGQGGSSDWYLVIRRELHGRHAVDVLFDLIEEVIPATDQAALVLIVDQV